MTARKASSQHISVHRGRGDSAMEAGSGSFRLPRTRSIRDVVLEQGLSSEMKLETLKGWMKLLRRSSQQWIPLVAYFYSPVPPQMLRVILSTDYGTSASKQAEAKPSRLTATPTPTTPRAQRRKSTGG